MKLLLTSAGISNPSIVKALQDLVNQPFSQLNLVFIPTAANIEEGDKGWLINDYINFNKLGLKSFDIVDISALPSEIYLSRIKNANIIVFSGGNTFHIMHWLRHTGLDKLLPDLLRDKVFVGISAGSMIASKSIFLTSDKPIYNEDRLGVVNDSGLGLINFYVRPHFNSPYFPLAKEKYIEQESKKITEPIYALDDNSAIKVDGTKVEVISGGVWKKFN